MLEEDMRGGSAALVVALAAACSGDHRAPGAASLGRDPNLEQDSPQRVRAIGKLETLPADVRPLFVPGSDFEPLPKPEPGDWLAEHTEYGQSYSAFEHSSPNLPTDTRRTIYLLPVGSFDADLSPPMDRLAEYARLYFTLPVKVLSSISVKALGATTRANPYTGGQQLLTTDILAYLQKHVPDDAYALIALTETDLYPEPSWNFVFGMASLRDRVGVYSFARYHPSFYGQHLPAEEARQLVLRRSLEVMVHELGHMFGIHHCIHWSCVMNGSNHMEESDSRPLHLCPVDLRKLYRSIGFDPRERYRALARFYDEIGFDAEAEWARARAAR